MFAAFASAALAICFGSPQPVVIDGYVGHAMEPFISRDGRTLFFNNRNAPTDQTDLFWATRIDDLHFQFRGPVSGANSDQLDGVASLSREGKFVYISPRAENRRAITVWAGQWRGDRVERPIWQPSLSPAPWPAFVMDAEISADGQHLYIADATWGGEIPRASDLSLAIPSSAGWRRAPEHAAWFERINTARALEYAPATSADERELYFTRLTPRFLAPPKLEILVAVRPDKRAAFAAPEPIASISGFVEAPTVAPDGALYFHTKVSDRYQLMRTPRRCSTQ